MSEMQKPTSVTFAPDAVKTLAAKDQTTPGLYRFIVTDAETKLAGTGSFMIVTKQSPLEDPEDPNSIFKRVVIRNNIILPMANPDVADHEAPNTIGICHSFLHALYPDEINDYPRWKDNCLQYNGEEIEKAEEEQYREEVTAQTLAKLEELWKDPSPLIDECFYAEAFQNGDFTNLKKISADLPDGAKLVARGEYITKSGSPAKVSNGMKPGGKNGAAKTVVKNGKGRK